MKFKIKYSMTLVYYSVTLFNVKNRLENSVVVSGISLMHGA